MVRADLYNFSYVNFLLYVSHVFIANKGTLDFTLKWI
jgi:hypothetical protein